LPASPSASQAFDTFLAANPPPSNAPPEGSWVRSDSKQRSAGISTVHAHGCIPCGEPRQFHWHQAQSEAAQLARTHDLHWSSGLDGYLCMPKVGKCCPAAAACGGQQTDNISTPLAEQQQQQQQQHQGSDDIVEADTAQQLLLKLPPILRSAGHMPQGRLADVIGGKAAPGVQLIVLLSADSAALAICKAGNIVRHKTMTGGHWSSL
jgi:hypothetical protein